MNDQLTNAPDEIGEMDFHILELRLELLRGHWTTFQTEHLAVAELSANDDARAVQDRLFSDTQLQYIAVGARYRSIMTEQQRNAAQLQHREQLNDACNNDDRPNGVAAQATAHLRFDKVSMTKFNGDYANWRAFRDQFTMMVHENRQLDNTTKFYFLNQFLEKEPARVIAGIAPTAANYAGAWQTLNERSQ